MIYANDTRMNIQIEPGMDVRQRQRLFYLPDLSKMEVAAMLHETVVKDVKQGMFAQVEGGGARRAHAGGARRLGGPVAVADHAVGERHQVFRRAGEARHDPQGLLPGMTAEVEIRTVRRHDALAVPAEAVTVVDGHDVCYVTVDDHVKHREVTLGQASSDLLEVTAGLQEGEEVVLDPGQLDGSVRGRRPRDSRPGGLRTEWRDDEAAE